MLRCRERAAFPAAGMLHRKKGVPGVLGLFSVPFSQGVLGSRPRSRKLLCSHGDSTCPLSGDCGRLFLRAAIAKGQ